MVGGFVVKNWLINILAVKVDGGLMLSQVSLMVCRNVALKLLMMSDPVLDGLVMRDRAVQDWS